MLADNLPVLGLLIDVQNPHFARRLRTQRVLISTHVSIWRVFKTTRVSLTPRVHLLIRTGLLHTRILRLFLLRFLFFDPLQRRSGALWYFFLWNRHVNLKTNKPLHIKLEFAVVCIIYWDKVGVEKLRLILVHLLQRRWLHVLAALMRKRTSLGRLLPFEKVAICLLVLSHYNLPYVFKILLVFKIDHLDACIVMNVWGWFTYA